MLRSLVGSEMCIRDSGKSAEVLLQEGQRCSASGLEVAASSSEACSQTGMCCWKEATSALQWGHGILSCVSGSCCVSQRSICASRSARLLHFCLLYTSDAADEEDSVDLGGRRILKQNTREMKK
eukprot:TRINITY_DN38977_c0_g1_i1.p1 TRINITY_DN38977_c0_g1~~TRINITY_DN38977_c0_g1_i1.p1  ORF type:complete len:124 (-),score=27.35 TRINITY_DN38977_c0_g1_i1:50-421(-)